MITTEQVIQEIEESYKKFSFSQKKEISRLVFEIAKREKLSLARVMETVLDASHLFAQVKNDLIKRRFPLMTKTERKIRQSFNADIKVDPSLRADVSQGFRIDPQHIYVEEAARDYEVVSRLAHYFPNSTIEYIEKYKNHFNKKVNSVERYNKRHQNFYFTKESFDFYKSCPCSPDSAHCGYHVVNLGSGCSFECTYCVLQDYLNAPGIVIPANLEDFFDAFTHYEQDIRVGSGEWTDSLVYDHITGYGPRIVEFFKTKPKSIFEFRTKSDNVDALCSVDGADNIVVSWSLNPQQIISSTEYFTASLEERLAAAQKCVEKGNRVAFHFDPIILHLGWEENYRDLIGQVFRTIPSERIAWMSLGTLRMTTRLKQIIETRFPKSRLLDEEFLIGHDGKLRYSQERRAEVYQFMREWVMDHAPQMKLYLCMEEKTLCQSSNLLKV